MGWLIGVWMAVTRRRRVRGRKSRTSRRKRKWILKLVCCFDFLQVREGRPADAPERIARRKALDARLEALVKKPKGRSTGKNRRGQNDDVRFPNSPLIRKVLTTRDDRTWKR